MEKTAFHKYLQFKLFEHSRNGTITRDLAFDILGKFRIPKKIRRMTLKDMKKMNLLKIQDKSNIQIINCEVKDEINLISRLSRREAYVNHIIY